MVDRCRVFSFLLVAALLIPCASAIKIFPTLTALGENYAAEQSFILTVLNDGAAAEKVIMKTDPESYYLMEYVKIEPQEFTLKSNSKKNVQITTDFPEDLSPEKHRLVIQPMTEDEIGEQAVYTFTVPGIARPDLRLSDISLDHGDESFTLDVELQNMGNVIARASPDIQVMNGSEVLDELEYESRIMVMPFEKYNLSLLYDTTGLGAGDYELRVGFRYNDNLKTNQLSADFSVMQEGTANSSGALSILTDLKYPIFIAIILVLLFFTIKPEYLKRVFHIAKRRPVKDKRLVELERRLAGMEKEAHELAGMTQAFIKESNDWLSRRFGNDQYKFS